MKEILAERCYNGFACQIKQMGKKADKHLPKRKKSVSLERQLCSKVLAAIHASAVLQLLATAECRAENNYMSRVTNVYLQL